ncbi:hypothetical protein P872_02930 [Rhodonellum psychrophilum GCM71 = DSM 17998]|uniref:Uncharacterized protein n=1 Tax=Rhodonellum psychrophilum GCM71 = DSM 17998 TaxID=1123057 RepID=U5C0H6_9BACT|nr:hypothetical protein P872_02930 [Rhodonellum psychrophilum GCM71 = DSM 17998]
MALILHEIQRSQSVRSALKIGDEVFEYFD